MPAAAAVPQSSSPDARPKLIACFAVDAEREQHRGGGADVGDRAARRDRDQRGGGRQAENDEGECRREADAERREEQRASERARRPAAEQEEPGGDRLARRTARVVGRRAGERRQPGPAGDERDAARDAGRRRGCRRQPTPKRTTIEQRQPEARRARRGRRDRQREKRDRVDEAERDDRERDRLEAELDAAHPAQRRRS